MYYFCLLVHYLQWNDFLLTEIFAQLRKDLPSVTVRPLHETSLGVSGMVAGDSCNTFFPDIFFAFGTMCTW